MSAKKRYRVLSVLVVSSVSICLVAGANAYCSVSKIWCNCLQQAYGVEYEKELTRHDTYAVTETEAALAAPGAAPGQVLLISNSSGPVTDRMAWAREQARTRNWTKGYWTGFGIRRLMGEHSSIGWFREGPGTRLSLDDLINGRKTPLEKRVAEDQAIRGTATALSASVRERTAARDRGRPERRVIREIGILFRWTAAETPFPEDIRVSNLTLPYDFEDLPFVWIGMAADSESLDYLMPLYAKAETDEDKLSMLRAVGLHRNAPAVTAFVERILAGKETKEIRAEAAECLGEQSDHKALEILLRLIKSDPSGRVRERAVWGLVEMELPEAADSLIALAMSGSNKEIRAEAVQGLADKATRETVKALEKISAEDKDPEIQKEAVRAFADLPRKYGLPYLINLVKTHSDAAVRKEAVGAIGDIGGAEAVKYLTELAKGKGR